MPRSTPSSPPEFTAKAVRLVGVPRPLPDPHYQGPWGRRSHTSKLGAPRRKQRQWSRCRDAACFANERDAIRSRVSRSSTRRRYGAPWQPCAACSGSPEAAPTLGARALLLPTRGGGPLNQSPNVPLSTKSGKPHRLPHDISSRYTRSSLDIPHMFGDSRTDIRSRSCHAVLSYE